MVKFMLKSIKSLFNKYLNQHREACAFKALQQLLGDKIKEQDAKAVSMLIGQGAKPAENVAYGYHGLGWQTGLAFAVTHGSAEVLQVMLQSGENPNFVTHGPYGGSPAGYYNKSLLYLAVEMNKPEHVKVLLAHPSIDRVASGGHREYHGPLSYTEEKYLPPETLASKRGQEEIISLFKIAPARSPALILPRP